MSVGSPSIDDLHQRVQVIGQWAAINGHNGVPYGLVQRWRATAQATLTDPEIAGRWDDDAGSPGRRGRRLCRRMASSSPGVAKRDVREKSRMCIARRVAPLSAIDDK
jgi:hypothetical protein